MKLNAPPRPADGPADMKLSTSDQDSLKLKRSLWLLKAGPSPLPCWMGAWWPFGGGISSFQVRNGVAGDTV